MSRPGYLCDKERERQARSFVAYEHGAQRAECWRSDFERWAGRRGKDFNLADRLAIRAVVEELMVAGGVSVFSDPFDYLRILHPEET